MDLDKVLQQLHEELKTLDAAIASLERLQDVAKRTTDAVDWMAEMSQRPSPKRARKTASKVRPTDPK